MAELKSGTPSGAVPDNQRSSNGGTVSQAGESARLIDEKPTTAVWLTFAAVMMTCGALLNSVWGIAALANDDRFVVDELWVWDLGVWGGLTLGFGLFQLVIAVLLFLGNRWGAGFGIAITVGNMVTQFAALGAYPVWSVVLIAIDALIIYGLCAYGFRRTGP